MERQNLRTKKTEGGNRQKGYLSYQGFFEGFLVLNHTKASYATYTPSLIYINTANYFSLSPLKALPSQFVPSKEARSLVNQHLAPAEGLI